MPDTEQGDKVTVTVEVRMVRRVRVLGTVRVLVTGHSIKLVEVDVKKNEVVVVSGVAVVTGHEKRVVIDGTARVLVINDVTEKKMVLTVVIVLVIGNVIVLVTVIVVVPVGMTETIVLITVDTPVIVVVLNIVVTVNVNEVLVAVTISACVVVVEETDANV